MTTVYRSCAALLAAALVGVATPAQGGGYSPPARRITLIHVNDTHSRVDSWGPKDFHLDGTLGGLTRAATVIERLNATRPNPVLVHAGDLHHGDLYFNAFLGVPEYLILEGLGLKAYAIGNHEFDLTPSVLEASLGSMAELGAPVPALSANLDLTGYGPPLSSLIAASRMEEVGGVKIGIFGLTNADPGEQLSDPEPSTRSVAITDPLAAARIVVPELRAAGAQVVVCLAHLGVEGVTALAEAAAGEGLGIDVVVQGHDHVAWPAPRRLGNSIVVSAGSYYRYVGSLELLVRPDRVEVAGYHLYPIDLRVPRSPAVMGLLSQSFPLEAVFPGFETPIAFALRPIAAESEEGSPNRTTPIGNLVTDIYRERGLTQIGLEVAGFAEEPLPWGPINGADVFRVQSYGFDPATRLGFKLVTLELSGAELYGALNLAIITPGGLFPQVSGLSLVFDSRIQVFDPTNPELVPPVQLVRVGDAELDFGQQYSVTTHEGIVFGLAQLTGQLPAFDYVKDAEGEDVFVYTALRDGIAARGWLLPNEDLRICDLASGACPTP